MIKRKTRNPDNLKKEVSIRKTNQALSRKTLPDQQKKINEEREYNTQLVKQLLKERYGDPPYPPMAAEIAARDLGLTDTTWHMLGKEYISKLTEDDAHTYFDWNKYKTVKVEKPNLTEVFKQELKPQEGPQTAFLASNADIVIFGGSAGGGKALHLSESIITPKGWKHVRELKDGDKIFGMDGSVIKIIELHPIVKEPCCRIYFKEGWNVDCNYHHLWKLTNGKIYNTKYLMENTWLKRHIPICGPLNYRKINVGLDPYEYGKKIACDEKIEKIPAKYLRNSYDNRLALLHGIMDTAGFLDIEGNPGFVHTNYSFIRNVRELILSLGIKCKMPDHYKHYKNTHIIKEYHQLDWITEVPMFRGDKLKWQNTYDIPEDTKYWEIDTIISMGEQECRCLTVDARDGMFLAGKSMIPTHNSFSLLLDPLRYVNNPDFGAVIFRRTYPEIKNEGGLWDEATKMYLPLGARPRETDLSFTFPSGAVISFAHLQYEKNIYNWQGSQIPYIGFDEITHFTSKQFWYLMSRQRNVAGIPNLIRATCNPDPDSFIRKVIDWWIGPSGYPIPDRSGVVRWFVREGENLKWESSKEKLLKKYPELMPRSLTFIPAKLTDNKILMDRSPEYMATLMSLPLVDRARLLEGNWDIRATSGLYFKKHYFEIIPKESLPPMSKMVRGWDLAGTSKKEQNVAGEVIKKIDATAGVKMGLGKDGFYYILDLIYGRFSPYEVENYVLNSARQDGVNTVVRLPQDPGQAGKAQIAYYAKKLAGFRYRSRVMTGDKVTRAAPLSSAAEHGLIRVVANEEWNDTLFTHLEQFPPQIGSPDIVDAMVEAFHELTDANLNVARIIPISIKM